MKFEFIKEVDEPVMSYGNMVSTGDVVELEGWLAEKAKRNPNYRLCDEPIAPLTGLTAGPIKTEDSDLEDLRYRWQAKFGTKPHHKKSAETLRRELEDGD